VIDFLCLVGPDTLVDHQSIWVQLSSRPECLFIVVGHQLAAIPRTISRGLPMVFVNNHQPGHAYLGLLGGLGVGYKPELCIFSGSNAKSSITGRGTRMDKDGNKNTG
jgi:hypothetical protein